MNKPGLQSINTDTKYGPLEVVDVPGIVAACASVMDRDTAAVAEVSAARGKRCPAYELVGLRDDVQPERRGRHEGAHALGGPDDQCGASHRQPPDPAGVSTPGPIS